MKDGMEIERKWLMGMLPDRYKSKYALEIVQTYGVDEFGPFRLRMQYGEDHPTQFFVTRKKFVKTGVFHEVELEMTMDEFDEALPRCTTKISKTRFVYEESSLKFEVDVYRDLTLITMEVELADIAQVIDIPDYILKCIIAEVTGDPHFSNRALSELNGEKKFKRWQG